MRSCGFSMATTVYGSTLCVSQTFEPIDGMVADHGVAAEDRGVGVDDDVVLERRDGASCRG